MEKVVVSLGGSVLVPGEDDARYVRALARLLGSLSSRVKLFVVTGGGRVARYYIETGRSIGIGERTLDEFGIAVTRLNARLLSAALRGRANREPATAYAEAARLARRYPIVVMGGTRPAHRRNVFPGPSPLSSGPNRTGNATPANGATRPDRKGIPTPRPLPPAGSAAPSRL